MNKYLTLAFIGGDLRQIQAIKGFLNEGHRVKIYAIDNISNENLPSPSETLKKCIENVDAVILPLPWSTDNKTIKAPLSNIKINIDEIINNMEKNQILLGGKINDTLIKLTYENKIKVIDYTSREEMSILNSIPTAEGAIQIAMNETPYTLHSSKCLVMGYGRIGKVLSASLKGLGALCSVSARKYSDLAWIKANGMKALFFPEDVSSSLDEYDIIFNTIPNLVLDFKLLSKTNPDCLIIDLASKPGGVDMETAQLLGRKVICALSLPGKVAPETAGKILKDTIINILDELEVIACEQ